MIAYMHTPDCGSFMVGQDYIPRIGEKMWVKSDKDDPLGPDKRDGLYEIQDVIYSVPNNPGRQRVDIYGFRLPCTPADLSYSAVMGRDYGRL